MLDALAQGPVGAGLAPNGEHGFPGGRATGQDEVPTVLDGPCPEARELGRECIDLGRPEEVPPDDAVAGVGLDGPARGVEIADTPDDR